jgi:hypothetical protein
MPLLLQHIRMNVATRDYRLSNIAGTLTLAVCDVCAFSNGHREMKCSFVHIQEEQVENMKWKIIE